MRRSSPRKSSFAIINSTQTGTYYRYSILIMRALIILGALQAAGGTFALHMRLHARSIEQEVHRPLVTRQAVEVAGTGSGEAQGSSDRNADRTTSRTNSDTTGETTGTNTGGGIGLLMGTPRKGKSVAQGTGDGLDTNTSGAKSDASSASSSDSGSNSSGSETSGTQQSNGQCSTEIPGDVTPVCDNQQSSSRLFRRQHQPQRQSTTGNGPHSLTDRNLGDTTGGRTSVSTTSASSIDTVSSSSNNYLATINSWRSKFCLPPYTTNPQLEKNAAYQGLVSYGSVNSMTEAPCPGSAQVMAGGTGPDSIDLSMASFGCEVRTTGIDGCYCAQRLQEYGFVWTERGHFDFLLGNYATDYTQIGCAYTPLQEGGEPASGSVLKGLWTCTLGNAGYENCQG